MADVKEIIEETISNLTQAQNATTTRTPATQEGMIVAYGSLVIMAVFPVFFGAVRSVKFHQSRLQKEKTSGQASEKMSNTDAVMFPFLASATLLVLYIVFKVFSKEYLNYIVTGYFYCLGVFALCHLLSPALSKLIPGSIKNETYRLKFTKGEGKTREVQIDYSFTIHDIICLFVCALLGLWYLLKKHWIANNLFGMAFAINGVEMLLLNNMSTGCILLMGLFVYDVFWVFYTDVMVTVAKSFEAPIKLVFPQDILEKGISANNFAMLGLGDIVVPGIFIALLLRFDHSLNRNKKTYFYASFCAYVLGLGVTILVMHMFKHAQPALLYLVPACLGIPTLIALFKGDIKAMFKYEDLPKLPSTEKKEKKPKNQANASETKTNTGTQITRSKSKSQAAASAASSPTATPSKDKKKK